MPKRGHLRRNGGSVPQTTPCGRLTGYSLGSRTLPWAPLSSDMSLATLSLRTLDGGSVRSGIGMPCAPFGGVQTAPGMHWKGGKYPPPPPSRAPSLCPATVPLTASVSFNGIGNRQ